ncbi:MAG: 2-methylthioadenine synthetase [Thermoprotei archaeon]|nr:MAG: 2-methylthioadenine synthetase [Thermoprotei archaeon]
MKVYVETYGCWLNKADSEVIKTILVERGATIVSNPVDANIIIINTCAVREDTERKILRRLRMLCKKTTARIVVAGCLAKARPATITDICPRASLVEPNAIEKISEVLDSASREILIGSYRREFNVLPEPRGITYLLPIEVGCVGACTYCIMPYTRGRVTSCPPEKVISTIKTAVKAGCKNIHLTAQDAAAYGLDLNYSLPKLLKRILSEVQGDYWLKISMMEPSTTAKIVNELVEVMRDSRIYKYIHIPVQSGDDRVLKLMNRRYNIREFKLLISKFVKSLEDVTFATDIIVGFPGEDDTAFKNTCLLIKELKPDKVHVARYTIRPFTLAPGLPQVSEPIKKHRSKTLVEIVDKVSLERNLRYLGKEVQVLITDKGKEGTLLGRTLTFKPVVIKNAKANIGEKILVKIHYINSYYLIGKPV